MKMKESVRKNMKEKWSSVIIKILCIVAVLMCCGTINNNFQVNAAKGIGDITGEAGSWISGAETPGGLTAEHFVGEFIGIGQILVSIGIATILIVTAIMAGKWIVATPDKQAKLKQQLIGLVISIVVIFGAVGIWNLVQTIMKDAGL